MKFVKFFSMFLLLTSCSFFKSDYDEIMGPIKKIKEEEKRLGKPNPVYDGVREPDFPDEVENNKTFDGVDSNHDGIRDDIEIWINRIGEDREVRISLKEYIKNFVKMVQVFNERGTENEKRAYYNHDFELIECASIAMMPYYKDRKIKGVNRNSIYDRLSSLEKIYFNIPLRNKLLSSFNTIDKPELGPFAADKKSLKNCSLKNDMNYLLNVWEKF